MDDRYRDETELHKATPLLAVLVAAMTLATGPMTQGASGGIEVAPSRALERLDSPIGFDMAAGVCMVPTDEPTCEAPAVQEPSPGEETDLVVSSSPSRKS